MKAPEHCGKFMELKAVYGIHGRDGYWSDYFYFQCESCGEVVEIEE